MVVELIRSDIVTSMRTTTDNDGFYAFKNMDSNNYILKFHPPSGFGFSLTDQGTDDSLDSDANQEDGTTIEFFYEKGKDDGRWDAGLIKTGPAPTATPTPTATPKPSSTPDPAQEVYERSKPCRIKPDRVPRVRRHRHDQSIWELHGDVARRRPSAAKFAAVLPGRPCWQAVLRNFGRHTGFVGKYLDLPTGRFPISAHYI